MLDVIDENDFVKKFDFSSIITEKDNDIACAIATSIIKSGNYFTNSPRFQTKENIFSRTEPIWLKYRMSFIFSVFLYLGREVKVSNSMAWIFMTNLSTVEDREKLWHHHHHKPNSNMLSGVFYLKIPNDVKDRDYCGTEISPKGPGSDGNFFIKPRDFSWIIYPSNLWHRPGITQSNEWRFVLAADIEYMLA
jgi:hypothetical protein